MIIDNEVLVKLSSSNINHYKNLGYVLPMGFDKRNRPRIEKELGLLVKINDLPHASSAKVSVKCEDCNEIRLVTYESIIRTSNYLKNGETLCSTCANKRMSGINNSQYKHGNNLYCFYRFNAKKRGYSFELTVEQFEKLIPSNCFYCGDESNGIDRWNNDIGYTIDNSVPCCGKCNFIKRTDNPKDFIDKIKKIYKTLEKKNLL